ncbi:unnamed protein product [Sphagnum troendelagicum]|uniref:ABC transporter domain-containing protein n=1 Tax=Sphagnum troendelagicum TaxID=128251 RepID=A0ABP0TXK6_9BRYO
MDWSLILFQVSTTFKRLNYITNFPQNQSINPPPPPPPPRVSFKDFLASPSPWQTKTYEIELRELCYKIAVKKKKKRNAAGASSSSSSLKAGMMPIKAAEVAAAGHHHHHYVLKRITCQARAGEILAVAGPSGAGKSTLLEVLAGRIQPSSPASSILVNGSPMDMQRFRRISGYVMQDDALFPMLTVEETLLYSARLRLRSTVPLVEKRARVEALMTELGLTHVAKTRIGNESVRGVSGGERRRVSIGVDVIHDPAVLILDEPTSGLDSAGALQVVAMLRNMAVSQQRTIILTIHQPGYRILQLVHSVLLLSHGLVVHHGPLELLSSRLAAAGHVVPLQVNVLEYAIDAIDSLHFTSSHHHHQGFTGGFFAARGFDKPAHHSANAAAQTFQEFFMKVADKVTFANSSIKEIIVLAHRFCKNIIRTRQLLIARTIQAIGAGFGLGSIYVHMGYGLQGAQERGGLLAFSLSFLLTSSIEVLPMFLEERHILIRETSRGAYRVSSYVLASTLVFLPFLFLVAMLYSVPMYWLVGLAPTANAFLFFLLVIWIVLVTANSFVAFFSALVSDFITGNSLVTGFMGAFFLFSGYFISKDNMPKYWLFMHYMSLFKYPLDALLINEYLNVSHDKCFGPVYGGHCFLTGDDVLAQAGLTGENKWANVAIMAGFALIYRILGFGLLQFKLLCKRQQ